MDGTGPTVDDVAASLEAGDVDAATARVERALYAPTERRQAFCRSLKGVADDRPALVAPVAPPLAAALTDEDRAVRLTTAKLFVAVARAAPDAVVPVVDPLAARLADEAEFYYVRARSAEALGLVALAHPDAVGSPAVLADLRVGLAFDEPAVREKLAKALECVARGNPDRLRHQASSLAEHLDDDRELVRYHLATALLAVGCASPERLAAVRDALVARLDDECPQVRGRAAEALGVLARGHDRDALPTATLDDLADDGEPFVADRARFALDADSGTAADPSARVGTLDGVRETTTDAVDAITSPAGEDECPHCGLVLPDAGPPMCPGCGAPR
ncbi:HEAT repeat domain-containing protein [Haloarchaeobius iranensis]|uniref:HEAT repeat-containing protein n=1 Tax=Haloarchaeobius iranensis TaxID=996166 RepID=A0A1G9YJA1_9EURY|nr:hypothetical protein [Haloarchaeobius iranensis]SDN08535.1 HEAT repeat-containing protein [Haloarchaeobius iranensis]